MTGPASCEVVADLLATYGFVAAQNERRRLSRPASCVNSRGAVFAPGKEAPRLGLKPKSDWLTGTTESPTEIQRQPLTPYATLLYDNFRSSLSHGFCIEQGRLEPGARHGRLDGRYGLEIDPWVLLRDLETALSRYLEDVRTDEELQESFEKRFNSVFRHWIRMSERRAQEQKRPEPKS